MEGDYIIKTAELRKQATVFQQERRLVQELSQKIRLVKTSLNSNDARFIQLLNRADAMAGFLSQLQMAAESTSEDAEAIVHIIGRKLDDNIYNNRSWGL